MGITQMIVRLKMSKEKKFLIICKREVAEELKELKLYERETYTEVIKKLIAYYKNNKS
jgi:hypothetical protein